MFKKIYFKFALLSYFLKKNRFYILFILAIGSSLYYFRYDLVKIKQLPIFQTKYIGLAGLYTTSNLPEEINNMITYGLTTATENNKMVNSDIVQSIKEEDNNHRYIIKLKNNIYWHNGKKLTADDINYEISGAVIKTIDNYTLMITTPNLFAPLKSFISLPLYKKNLIGLGPYRVIKIKYQDGYIKTLVLKNIKTGVKNIYKFYTSDTDLITAFKLGEIKSIETNYLPSDFEKMSRISIDQKINTNKKYLAIFFNTEKISSKADRQALAYATPKTKEKSKRAISPISPSSWAYNPSIKEYNFNPTRATELFEKDSLQTIKIAVADRQLLDTAESIKKSWQEILGIKVETQIVNKIDPQNFDAFLAYGGIPSDPDQYLFWHSTQTDTNLTRFNNSRIDKLLEDGRLTFDFQTRREIYLDFQRYLLEEVPAIFLSYPTTYIVSRLK